jgi:RND superfamily putative drug exporter
MEDQVSAAHAFAAREIAQPGDALVGVTGPLPGRLKESDLILHALPYVELATILLIALILAVYFRSVGPPLITLAAAGLAYQISIHVVAWVGDRIGLTLPRDLEPVLVVLLLGIATDYSIFFLSGYRFRLAAGEPRVRAAQQTTADFVPIIFTAGLIVAAGTAALVVASLGFLRAFGPGLAITVLITLAVAITFIPAVLATFGRLVYWPRHLAPATPDVAPRSMEHPDRTPEHGAATLEGRASGWRTRLARRLTAKPVAALVALACIAALIAAASGLVRARLGFTLIHGLPGNSEEARAAKAAEIGFSPGILSPTEVLFQGSGLQGEADAISRLQERLQGYPGVAGVIGPVTELTRLDRGMMFSSDGRAARLVVILSDDPEGGGGIDILGGIEHDMPAMMRAAGLRGVTVSYAGDTALAREAIHTAFHDLGRAAAAALLIDLVLLVVFLRGVIAPLYLLAASVLGLAAALGLTTYMFIVVLGHGELTYFVPFGVGILLVSLGSDYNVFVVGRIWEEARRWPLRDAISIAAPRASRTITLAGVVLAASFGLLALVPLDEFREFAFAMAAGILLDTFLVRSVLVPALIAVAGRASWWPATAPRPQPVPAPSEPAAA